VIVADADGRVVFLNPVAQSLTGWSQEEALGQPLDRIFRIVNEHTRKKGENPASRALREGTVVGLANHTLLIGKDDRERPIDDSAAPIHNAQGQVGVVVLIFRDITERRRAERLAEDARLYAESIVATVREPLVVLDGDLRVWTANRSFYTMFRVRPEETEGRLLYDLGDGQWDIPALRKLLGEILPQNMSFDDFEVEHDFPSLGKKVMLLNARRVYREGNHAELILLAIEDVTALREAERRRQEVETRFTEMVKNVRDHSIFLTDPDGRITSWNVAAERVIGYTEAEAVGRHFSLVFTPEDLQNGLVEHELRQAREEGRAEDERWHVKKDGTRFWALGIVTPLHDPNGRLTGFSKILRDITERKQANDLLQRQAEALREAERRKNEFLAMLGHELRNPLAPLCSGLEVMRLAGGDAGAVERARTMMERQLAQMVRLVDDLLDVSRITRGKLQLRRERVDLAGVDQSALEGSRPLVEASGHRLTVSLPPEPVELNADPMRLAQVLANLLTNAAKYTERGGDIRLTAERKGGEVAVSVRDTGIGIAAEHLPRLFEMFSQAAPALEKSQGGLGIGLSLARGLAEMHGGTIEARSDGPGKGSEFVVRLPLADRSPGRGASPAGVEKGSGDATCRILVADDNRDAADTLAMMLRLLGHEVHAAHDGREALEAAGWFRPDLALLDLGMPKLNGLEVARLIREQPWGRGMVLVAISGRGQEEDKRRATEAGFDRHLTKPVDPATLEKLLAERKRV
jgi:PAS domain S-box-containing protein